MDNPVFGELQLCGCGSGLRRQRCCGFDPYSWGPFVGAAPLEPLIRQAVEAAGHADREAAIRLCLDVLELVPWHAGCVALLARLHLSADNRTAAEALLRRAVKINPNDLLATQSLCMLLFNNAALAEAEVHARNAVRIAPDNPQSHNMMGMVLTEANRPQIGEYHYRKVLELIDRPDAIVLANLAWNLKQQGRIEEARLVYRQSVELRPNELKTLLGWARLEEADREFDAAARLLEQAERVAPGDSGVRLTRAAVAARQGRTDAALTELDALERANGAGMGRCWTGWDDMRRRSPRLPRQRSGRWRSERLVTWPRWRRIWRSGSSNSSWLDGLLCCRTLACGKTLPNRYSFWVFRDPERR
jgi:tetratricopeptide (TPR) repeat protein